MNISWLRGFAFQLALLCYAGIGVTVLSRAFNTSTRWLFLGLLAASLLARGKLLLALESKYFPAIAAYCVWGIATSMWSEVPQLSAMKSGIYAVSILVFLSAGQFWVSGWRPKSPISYLAPIIPVALLAGFGPGGFTDVTDTGVNIYWGLAGNSNFLGMLAALGTPLAILLSYRYSRLGLLNIKAVLSFGLLAALLVVLARSGSRAAILCFIAIAGSFIMALRADRRILAIVSAGCVAVGAFAIVPTLQQGLYEHFVVKGAADNDVFYSRRTPWAASYDAAVSGGLAGVGFGVTAGSSNFQGGLTAQLYGREKANSQTAVWEETGFIGVVLYVAVIIGLFGSFARALRVAPPGEDRLALYLTVGALAGLIMQSIFEGWWTSPGSLEACYFWSTAGVATGLSARILQTQPVAANTARRVGPIGRPRSLPASPAAGR